MQANELNAIIKDFENLLNRSHHTHRHEQDIQEFLERYPFFLPGLYEYHNGPLGEVVISKPPVGLNFRADFAFASTHTAWYKIIFVEIEDPCKEIFTKKGELNSKFRQARNQLRDWVRTWHDSKEALIKDVFAPVLGCQLDASKLIGFKGYLVCGRRSDVESSPVRSKNWADETPKWGPGVDVEVMTYDRLINPITIAHKGRGAFNLKVCRYRGQRLVPLV